MGGLTAGLLDNRTILEKADLALADLTTGGGLLAPAQAQKFMRILINEAVILKQATVVPMRSPKQLIEKIRFANRILRAGVEAAAERRAGAGMVMTDWSVMVSQSCRYGQGGNGRCSRMETVLYLSIRCPNLSTVHRSPKTAPLAEWRCW